MPTVTAVPERPRPPAAAWHQMVDVIPDDYLDAAPPLVGVELCVVGRDNVGTYWRMDEHTAHRVTSRLRWRPGVRVTAARSYDDRGTDLDTKGTAT